MNLLREFIKKEVRNCLDENNSINEGLFDMFKKSKPVKQAEIFKQTPSIWTHATWSEDLINRLLKGEPFIGEKEDLSKFNVPNVGKFGTLMNNHAPNFKKGSIFHGFETHEYLITTELPDEAFQPNWNRKNYDNLEDSQNVAVLKPDVKYRKAENFKLWKKNNKGEFELIK